MLAHRLVEGLLMDNPTIANARLRVLDYSQAEQQHPQARAQGSQYPYGATVAKAAPASGSATQSREVLHG